MKKESYIQYGLVAIVVGLILFRSREGFEQTTEAKCPPGTLLRGNVCVNTSGPGTDATCPPGTESGRQGQCVGPSGISQPPSVCPQGKEALYGKCYDTTPICGETSEYVMTYAASGIPDKGVCVPRSSTTYEMTLPQGRPPTREEIDAACRPGDKMIGKFTGMEGPGGIKRMCLSTTTGASVGATGSTGASVGATGAAPQATSATPVNNSLTAKIREVTDSLKPFRPPTAPSSDLEKERKEITNLATRNLYFIQIALFLVVLSMLSYFMFSLDTANLIAFGLLCVGIALGFFLRR
jgi:hypothetical protein